MAIFSGMLFGGLVTIFAYLIEPSIPNGLLFAVACMGGALGTWFFKEIER